MEQSADFVSLSWGSRFTVYRDYFMSFGLYFLQYNSDNIDANHNVNAVMTHLCLK